ncbi:phosphotransferase family protein [Craurococcus roseus]|uniref:Phosphotransferase family protein n=1 Tax=Craurococcus roseus TaxID=77585 RepID=A0ABN1FHU1_9PROT
MDEAARARLADWLTAAAGAPVEIASMALLSGGAVQQNWAMDVSRGGAPERWVLRTDNAAVLAVSLPRTAEFALLRAAFGAGVTVPEPLFCCDAREVTGAPFFVMRRAEGVARGHVLVRQAAASGGDPALAAALGRELAAIHSIRPPRDDLAMLAPPPDDPARDFVVKQRAALDAAGTPRPVLEWGLRHLERGSPPPGDVVLNHNDFRTGNYMVHEGRVTAVLDWEFAAWGDPHADLGWLCAPCWRFGGAHEAGGIGPRSALYEAYEAASGRRVDPGRVHWWELAATIRWAVIAADQAERHLSGRENNLELALTGHIVPELEMDVLRMTGALDA